MLRRVRFVASIGFIYILTIGTIAGILQSSRFLDRQAEAAPVQVRQSTNTSNLPVVVSGKPTRIIIDGTDIAISIIDGYYDASTDNWTLSDTQAQYATMSALANNQQGTTFIYGHGTDAVFGAISEHHPALGTLAHIETSSGHTFTYKLIGIHDYTPNDTSILNDLADGSPRLIVQTCSGALSQWRTMFMFEYQGVQ